MHSDTNKSSNNRAATYSSTHTAAHTHSTLHTNTHVTQKCDTHAAFFAHIHSTVLRIAYSAIEMFHRTQITTQCLE